MEGHSANSPSRAVLHSQARELVFRVNRYFIQEKANREPLLPLTQARKRTAHATGVSEATVKRICSKDNRICDTVPQNTPVFTSPKKTRSAFVTNLDDFDKCVVRRTILGFYVRKEIPTLHKVKEELREKIESNPPPQKTETTVLFICMYDFVIRIKTPTRAYKRE